MSAIAPEPFTVVIPSRYASTRLPGKPLSLIAGRPMIRWVWERARASGAADVIIATDDTRIAEACQAFGADVEMTSASHVSGTDRLAEVVHNRNIADSRIVVNVQGDEPMISPRSISDLAAALHRHPDCHIATPVTPVESVPQFLDPNCVKAVRSLDGSALYFSRAPIPWSRDHQHEGRPVNADGAWRHIGLYAYRAVSLRRFAAWEPTALESVEKLEQLRALEYGMKIHLMILTDAHEAGIDTPEDLERLNARLAGAGQSA